MWTQIAPHHRRYPSATPQTRVHPPPPPRPLSSGGGYLKALRLRFRLCHRLRRSSPCLTRRSRLTACFQRCSMSSAACAKSPPGHKVVVSLVVGRERGVAHKCIPHRRRRRRRRRHRRRRLMGNTSPAHYPSISCLPLSNRTRSRYSRNRTERVRTRSKRGYSRSLRISSLVMGGGDVHVWRASRWTGLPRFQQELVCDFVTVIIRNNHIR